MPRTLEGYRPFLSAACTTVVGMLFFGAAIGAALRHPVAPLSMLSVLVALSFWVMWRPNQIWFLLPALLPVANFMPWTGWWLVDESDLLLLALLAGTYMRWGVDAWRGHASLDGRMPLGMRWLCWAMLVLLVLGSVRGLDDARGSLSWTDLFAALWTHGAYGDYDLPGNTLRVAKSLWWGLWLAPILCRSIQGSLVYLARGMLFGLLCVVVIVLWERALYVGWLDFTTSYRTVAWFWEMHVGGAAIDAYLVMALPFAWWAVWSAPQGWRWYAAAVLVLLATYAVLTTYSRGLYLAVILTAVGMAVLAHIFQLKAPDATFWHRRAMACLLAAVVLEVLAVWSGGVFMSDRLVRSNTDLYQRVAHWKRGVALLHTPEQWLWGVGAGRLPAHYSTQTDGGSLPGSVRWLPNAHGGLAPWLFGPERPGTSGELGLTQRVASVAGEGYTVRMRADFDAPVWMKVQLCEQHLLYMARCQLRTRQVTAASKTGDGWLVLPLLGPAFVPDEPFAAMRGGVLSIKVLHGRGPVALQEVELIDPSGGQLLKNSDFAHGAHFWSPIAYGNFLPWHMDNLVLELLIERGAVGLLALAAVVSWALVTMLRQARRGRPLALVVGAAIMAVLMAGMVVSVTEIPRVCLVLWLLLVVSFCINDDRCAQVAGSLPDRRPFE